MDAAKNEILDRIRTALGSRGGTRVDEYRAIERKYRQGSNLDREARVALFLSRIEHYDGGVFRCARDHVRETLAGALSARGRRRVVVPPGLPADWWPAADGGCAVVADQGLSHDDLDRSDGAVTACTVAIAMTGTIVLCHSPSEGRRAITLVPDYHLCVVGADQIVETVPEAIRHLAALRAGSDRTRPAAALVTTISGPSATSDIEMTRIKGVHGPRTLDVVIVDA